MRKTIWLVLAAIAIIVVIAGLAVSGLARQRRLVSRGDVESTTVLESRETSSATPSLATQGPAAQRPTVVQAGGTLATAVMQLPSTDVSPPSPQPTEAVLALDPETPLYYNDFSSLTSGWSPFFVDERGDINGYSAGAYQFRAITPGQMLYDVHTALLFSPRRYAVDVTADGDGSFGLLLGVQGEPTRFSSLSYLAVVVTTQGQILLIRREASAQTPIANATLSAIFQPARPIRLGVDLRTDGASVSIDGTEVLFAPNVQIPNGSIGLFTVAGARPIAVTFDNLMTTGREPQSTSLCAAIRRLAFVPSNPASGDDVVLLKERLARLGYMSGNAQVAEQTYGPDVEVAIQNFQRRNGVNESGVGPQTWCRVLSSDAVIATDDRTERLAAQQHLRQVDLDPSAGLNSPLFISVRQADESWRIAVVVPGDPRPFYLDTEGDALDPAWSPDRQRLAFTSNRSGTGAIWTLDTTTGSLRQLSPSDLDAQFPTWSPDGRTLFYTGEPIGGRAVEARGYLVDVETGQIRLFSDEQTGWADWSVNNELVFTRWTGRSYDIFRANPDGSGLINLTNTDDRDEDIPAWSVDGSQIAFVVNPLGKLEERQVFVIGRDGSGARQLTSLPGPNSNPVWLPDDRTIAYANQSSPEAWQPWLIDIDGSNARQLGRNEDRIWFMGRA